MPPWRSFRKSVSQPSSAPASNDLFLLNTLCDAVFVLSTLVTGLKNSVIVGNNSDYLSNLTNWIKPRRSENDWKLCWRASRHGWDSNKFHSLCDEKGPTITIVKVEKYIFGGYTSLSWSEYSSLFCVFKSVLIVTYTELNIFRCTWLFIWRFFFLYPKL